MHMPILLRRLVLLGTPLILIAVGLLHPQADSLSAMLAVAPAYLALHLGLIAVFSLMGLAGWLLTSGLHSWAAWLSRVAMLVFVPLYIAYDMFAGVVPGFFFTVARSFSADQQASLYNSMMAAVESPLGVGVALSLFGGGTLAWIVGMSAAAVALARAGISREPIILLVLAGLFLVGDHSSFLGSIAFGCFFLAAAWLEYAPRRLISRSAQEAS